MGIVKCLMLYLQLQSISKRTFNEPFHAREQASQVVSEQYEAPARSILWFCDNDPETGHRKYSATK